ncbi:MAG TPA: MarR family transcriptional regulator [Acidimicrobiales bacterium]
MLAKPRRLLDRELEWRALARFVERGQRLAVVYGPRRVGKSFLLDALCRTAGGHRYQAVTGTPSTQLDDFGRVLGDWLGAGPLRLAGWDDGLGRLARLDTAVVVIDELPYLTETSPELTGLLQRHVDRGHGPPVVLAGSSLATMHDLVSARAPLYGRSAAVVVPSPFAGRDLARLWRVREPVAALWVDAAVGGLPGYRPLLEPPAGDLDAWMVDEVLAPGSPLLDAAEAALADTAPQAGRGVHHTILAAIAGGDRTFSGIARVAGQPTGALSRPLAALERAGLVTRVVDPLRSRRDTYDLADPHLRTWLTIIAPHRFALQAGRARQVWAGIRATTWRSRVLGPRWEAVVRAHAAGAGADAIGPVEAVGATTVADRAARTSHEIDLVAMRGGEVVAVGEAKLRRFGRGDLDRLRRIRDLVHAPGARLVLASAEGVDAEVAREQDVVPLTPDDVYA